MGFWAKLFGRANPATSGTIAPEDAGPKPASEFQAPEQQSSIPPPTVEPVGPEDGGDTTADPDPRSLGASAPAPAPDPEPDQLPNGVQYLRTTHGVYPVDPQFQATRKVYRAQSLEEAIAFLNTQVVTEPLFYIEVETPDGSFAIDKGQRIFDANGRFI